MNLYAVAHLGYLAVKPNDNCSLILFNLITTPSISYGNALLLFSYSLQNSITSSMVFTSLLLGLVLNLISDLTYRLIDPRIDFDRRSV